MTAPVKGAPKRTGGDGRSSRWDAHRETRRAEFVAAAARAIEVHGPDVHLAEIAAEAGVSKPVLYRYFSDKDDLLGATTRWVAAQIQHAVTEVVGAERSPRLAVENGVRAYLAEVERHRSLFLLAVRSRGPAFEGSVVDGKSAVAAAVADRLRPVLAGAGADVRAADPWAHAVVGVGVSTAQWWLEEQTMSREELAGYLTQFIWHALDGISRDQLGLPAGS